MTKEKNNFLYDTKIKVSLTNYFNPSDWTLAQVEK